MSSTIGEEKQLQHEYKDINENLEKALMHLENAKNLDVDDQVKLDNLKMEIKSMQSADNVMTDNPEKITARYNRIIEEIKSLMD